MNLKNEETLMRSRINRFAALLLSFLLAAALLTGCADGKEKLSGRIAHIYGGTLLIAGDDGELYFAAIGDAETDGVKLAAGQYAEMEYRGGLKETYPAEIIDLEKIMLTGEESNIIDLYLNISKEAIGDLEPQWIAYDFSETDHLTAAEQQSVGYILWTEMDAEPYYGTEEELQEQGVLTEMNRSGAYLRGGCILRYLRSEEDPQQLTVKIMRNADTEGTLVYRLAENEGEWTAELLETSAE